MKTIKIFKFGVVVVPLVGFVASSCNISSFNNLSKKQQEENYSNSKKTIDTPKTFSRSYSLFIGDKEKVFNNETNLLNYVEKNFLTTNTYHKRQNFVKNQGTSEISQNTILLQEEDPLVTTFKKSDGSYTYALNNDTKGLLMARNEAALSYIDVHNVYVFDNHHFDNTNDIETYIRKFSDEQLNTLVKGQNSNLKALRFPNGVVKTFNNIEEIKASIAAQATPYYKDANNNLIPLTQNNLTILANALNEKDLAFVPIQSTNGKTMQVVDMDTTTPNGNFYGSYLTESGIGMEGMLDPYN